MSTNPFTRESHPNILEVPRSSIILISISQTENMALCCGFSKSKTIWLYIINVLKPNSLIQMACNVVHFPRNIVMLSFQDRYPS